MMPKTLLGRLLLVLFASTAIAQLLTFGVLQRERPAPGGAPTRAAPWVREVSKAVRVLEMIQPTQRSAALAILLGDAPFVTGAIVGDWPDAELNASKGDDRFGLELQWQLPLNTVLAEASESGQTHSYRIRLSDGSGIKLQVLDAGAGGPLFLQGPGAGPPMFFSSSDRDPGGVLFGGAFRLPGLVPRQAPWYLFGFGIPLLVGLLACGVFVIARQLTGPLARVARAADQLGGDLRRPPIPEEGPLEARQLARAFNLLRERLIAYVEERTRILAAMSHDLRTPITRLRLRAESIVPEDQRLNFERDLDEVHTLVESTLDLLRGVGRAEPLSELNLCEVLAELQNEFDELGWDVSTTCAPECVVRCRRLAIKRCLRNIIENAVKYGLQARVSASVEMGQVTVRVQDRGPGLPEHHLQTVFQPFFRLERSRSRETGGLGLGLSIAREIAEFHNAVISLRNAPEGGAICELRFPASKQVSGAGDSSPPDERSSFVPQRLPPSL